MPVECIHPMHTHNYHASGLYFQLYYGHWTDYTYAASHP